MNNKANKRPFVLGIFEGVFARFGYAFTDANTVLPVFVSLLTSSRVAVGYIVTMRNFGMFAPSIFVAGFTEHWERRKTILVVGGILRTSVWFSLFLMAYFWGGTRPFLLLSSFLILYGIARLGMGLCIIPFMDIVGKGIAPQRRGQFFSLRMLWGGLFSATAGITFFLKWRLRVNGPAT